jgi:ribonuclease HI
MLRSDGKVTEAYGCESHTTNNRMEIKAAVEGLRALVGQREVLVLSDSQYLVNATMKWLPKWKARGWKLKPNRRTGEAGPVKNQELWIELDELMAVHDVRFQWVKGHASHADNIRADELANRAAREQISSSGVPEYDGEELPV